MLRNLRANTSGENALSYTIFAILEPIRLLTLSMIRNLGANTSEENAPTLHHFRHF